MKIYTKKGDDGTTGLCSGERVDKSSLRVETYGTVDELNSIIGIVVASNPPERIQIAMRKLNNILFNLGSDLATLLSTNTGFITPRISEKEISWLENIIDEYTAEMPPLKHFILPGATLSSAYLHQARTVCRRAERLAVRLSKQENIGEFILKFMNRLSDFLFTAARMTNFLLNKDEIIWDKEI